MNPEQWLSLKWNGGSTMSDRWLNQSKIIQTSQKMINHAIKAQIILYFCLPLSLALIHSYVGIKTAKILISTLGKINITKAAAQSLIIVIVIYIGYMIATYLGSKSMLKEK